MASNQVKELFELLCERYTKYSKEKRASTQPIRLQDIQKKFPDYTYNPQDKIVREPLLEHVGVISMFATTIYPYLNREDVDLGEALTMLAIHDIGELVTGDTMVYMKKEEDDKKEQEEALKILEPIYHDLYNRVENPSDPTAQFAKSVDKIVADVMDYLSTPDSTRQRYKSFTGTDVIDDMIQFKLDFKHSYMKWDKTMEELFLYTVEQVRLMLEKG